MLTNNDNTSRIVYSELGSGAPLAMSTVRAIQSCHCSCLINIGASYSSYQYLNVSIKFCMSNLHSLQIYHRNALLIVITVNHCLKIVSHNGYSQYGVWLCSHFLPYLLLTQLGVTHCFSGFLVSFYFLFHVGTSFNQGFQYIFYWFHVDQYLFIFYRCRTRSTCNKIINRIKS